MILYICIRGMLQAVNIKIIVTFIAGSFDVMTNTPRRVTQLNRRL